MSGPKYDKHYKAKPPFRQVEGIESPVWDQLTPHAVWCLLELYRKFYGNNRYDLSLTRGDVKHKMSPPTLTKSIWELIAFGFIDRLRWGYLEKKCSIYGLSHRWKKIGNSPQNIKSIKRLLIQIEEVSRNKKDENKKYKVRAMQNKILRIGGHPLW